MIEHLQVGDFSIEVTRKDIKHVHLSVHPPQGRVTLSAPTATRLDVVRAYVISRLGWIRQQQTQFRKQARETPRRYVQRESHYVWGRRYLMAVIESDAKQGVSIGNTRITLYVRPGSSRTKRAEIIHEWHKNLLHQHVPGLIARWEPKLKVKVSAYFLQRMKTKWGSCNHHSRHIRLNTELAKKPKDLIEYVVVHEMLHLIEPNHSERFVALLSQHYPSWREARLEINDLPLADETWGE